jgi:hypothetical protein
MRLTILVVAAAVAFGAVPRPAAAQSLAEIAAKEKERRKGTGTGGKVITESDLGSASQGTSSLESETSSDADAETPAEGASTAEGAAKGDKGGPKEKSEDEKRAELQASLQKQLDGERAQIDGIKKDIAAREVELADTSNYLIGGRRTALLKYVEDAKQAIATHEAQVEKLQEQARREGISVR